MASLPASAEAALDRMTAAPDVRRVILYGSRAVGDADERSDIDIAVSAPELDARAFARLRDDVAQSPTLYTISVARLEDMPDALQERVLAQGQVIYERP